MRRYSLAIYFASVLLSIVINGSTFAAFVENAPARGSLRANVETVKRVLLPNAITGVSDHVTKYMASEGVVNLIEHLKEQPKDIRRIDNLKSHIDNYNRDQVDKVELSQVLSSQFSKKDLGRMFQTSQDLLRGSVHYLNSYFWLKSLQFTIFEVWINKGVSIAKLYEEFQLDKSNNVLENPLIMVFAEYIVQYAFKKESHDTFVTVMTEKMGGEANLIDKLMDSDPRLISVKNLKEDLIQSWRKTGVTTEDVMRKLDLLDVESYLTKKNNRDMLLKYVHIIIRIKEFRRIFGDDHIVFETRGWKNSISLRLFRYELYEAWREAGANQIDVFHWLKFFQDVNADVVDEKLRTFNDYFELETTDLKTMSELFGGNKKLETFLNEIKVPINEDATKSAERPSMLLRELLRKQNLLNGRSLS